MRIVFLALFCLAIYGSDTKATEFGLGPCCSGSICGIIPCDKSCGGRAIEDMGDALSDGFHELSNTYRENTRTSNSASEGFVQFYKDWGQGNNSRLQEILSAIEALTIKYDVSKRIINDSLESFSDLLAQTFINSLKRKSLFENLSNESDRYSQLGQSPLLDELTEKIGDIQATYDNENIQAGNILRYGREAYTLRDESAELLSDSAFQKKLTLWAQESKTRLGYIGSAQPESDFLKTYYPFIVNAVINESTDLNRLGKVYSSTNLSQDIHEKEKLSKDDATENLVIASLTNPDAYMTIKSSSKEGLMRHMAVQKQLANSLLNDFLSVRKKRVFLEGTK